MIYTEKKINNIPIYINKTTMLKNVVIRLCCLTKTIPGEETAYSILRHLLMMSCKKYNTKRKMFDIQYENYNLNFNVSFNRCYKMYVCEFIVEFVNGKYINEPQNVDNAIKLFKEFVFNPDIDSNNFFNQKYFKEMVYKIRNALLTEKNNKDYYAYMQLLRIIFKDSIISNNTLGNLNDLNKLTSLDVYKCYENIINNSTKMLYITGDVDDDIVDKLSFLSVYPSVVAQYENIYYESIDNIKTKEVFEKSDVNQAKLYIGLRYNVQINQDNICHLNLFSAMLGELQSSTLFQVIREQNGLAYSIESSITNSCGLMIINAGIDKEDYSKTITLIKQIFKDYQDGKISKELLQTAIESKVSNLERVGDYPPDYDIYHINSLLIDIPFDLNEKIKAYKNTTIEDIKEIANKMVIDTIYMLSN